MKKRVFLIIRRLFLIGVILYLISMLIVHHCTLNMEIGEMAHLRQEICGQQTTICMIAENQKVTFTTNNDEVYLSITERDLRHGDISYTLGDSECFDLQVNGARIISITPLHLDRFALDKTEFKWLSSTATIPAYTPDGRIVTYVVVELMIPRVPNTVFTIYLYRADVPSP